MWTFKWGMIPSPLEQTPSWIPCAGRFCPCCSRGMLFIFLSLLRIVDPWNSLENGPQFQQLYFKCIFSAAPSQLLTNICGIEDSGSRYGFFWNTSGVRSSWGSWSGSAGEKEAQGNLVSQNSLLILIKFKSRVFLEKPSWQSWAFHRLFFFWENVSQAVSGFIG